MTDETLPLAAEFPPTGETEWRRLVTAALKGADFDKKLVSRTYDGLRVEPLYPRATKAVPVAGRPAQPWHVMARVDHPDPAEANRQALIDLENGATGLTLVMAGSLSANGYGLDASPTVLERVLKDVVLDAGIAIDFSLSPATRRLARLFTDVVKARGVAPGSIAWTASLNPVGGFAASGARPGPWSELSKSFAAAIREFSETGFRGPFAVADGRVIHNAGGSEAQELAFMLGSAVEYLRALEAGGVPLDAARGMIYFRLSADADEFLSIAKFRSIRKLWARVEEACGLTPKPALVNAETAWRMMTRRDPDVNLLRLTIAIAAAGLGGADTITALPHTVALGLPDAFARRVVRNIHLVLLEESNLYRVADPAAGSGAIEALTDELCAAAWSQFQDIEKAGGAWAALEAGLIQKNVAAVRTARQAAVARRKDPITGSSDYPNLGEKLPAVLAVTPIPPPKEAGAIAVAEPLPRIRLAEPFEALRDRTDRALKTVGLRPKVLLANLGTPSDFTARTTFAKNFYEAGGIEAVGNNGFASVDDMIATYKKSGAKLTCLCSSDKVYAEQAAKAAKALTAAGAIVHLAGRPGDHESEWQKAGVKVFIYAGCDVLATLQATHDSLGVQ